ncbi:dihydroorotate dehydrogenase electron transfer subunit [Heyndrickxia camelliae]|uniref:Dihydroorotate dehydrogenase B (NAD(+)), electron transfer subunit n=1 Tax=Heyndrickxia camelliae TaxID=1707093 RepID=A0A2N3LQZ4_9BACI|nr:dihydroorotate dehydrogenase electron transfer subunit [Heyndrickxia camelliae]PKR86995.1 dihydroorotate dehydrogenase electron transfer subunit [Heyndrickxia camelliae]
MIRQEDMTIISQKLIATGIYELILKGNLVNEMEHPGQFVHIRVNQQVAPLLRRPISIATVRQDLQTITLIYRAEGEGTSLLAEKKSGEKINVMGPLGNGFPTDDLRKGQTALLVGGGIGVPPLYELSLQLRSKGIEVIHVLGFESAEKSFYLEKFSELGKTYVATVDGSLGTKGFVTDAIEQEQINFDCLYTCGPLPMLRALEERYASKQGYISLEQRMACGIGACLACVCHVADDPTKKKYRKACSDGPVFRMGEVII